MYILESEVVYRIFDIKYCPCYFKINIYSKNCTII